MYRASQERIIRLKSSTMDVELGDALDRVESILTNLDKMAFDAGLAEPVEEMNDNSQTG